MFAHKESKYGEGINRTSFGEITSRCMRQADQEKAQGGLCSQGHECDCTENNRHGTYDCERTFFNLEF